ncbi:CHRD domain-containing protein [bacterium]|nr:CHRD domain-containing protein [bacterium]
MKRYLFLLCFVKLYAAPVVFNTTLSPANILHHLYHPKEKNIHRPYFSSTKLHRRNMVSPAKAIGSGTFLYHTETNEIEYAIAYSGLSSPPVMIHLMLGYPHQKGVIIATLLSKDPSGSGNSFKKSQLSKQDQLDPTNRSGFLSGKVRLKKLGNLHSYAKPQKEEKMLLQGGCYVTIHTHLNELGELRGQLTPIGSHLDSSSLEK